jgi:hypothetical protein
MGDRMQEVLGADVGTDFIRHCLSRLKALDDVAVLVELSVEHRWPAAAATVPTAVGLLVCAFGDVPDASPAQVSPDGLRAVALVSDDVVRPDAKAAGTERPPRMAAMARAKGLQSLTLPPESTNAKTRPVPTQAR